MTDQQRSRIGDQSGAGAGAGGGSGSGLAVASLILGILGFCTLGVTGLIALILGGVALSSGRRQPGGRGRGMAIAGMIIGGLSLIAGPVLLMGGLLLPALGKARVNAKLAMAEAQMKQVGLAASIYAMDFEGYLPPAEGWIVAMDAQLHDPDMMLAWPGEAEQGRVFAMNEAMGGRILEQTASPATTVLFFECAPGSAEAGGPELLPDVPRAYDRYLVTFADGHVELVPQEMIGTLIWYPTEGDAE